MRLRFVLMASVLVGCAELPDAPSEQTAPPSFRLASNSLPSDDLVALQLATRPLGKHRLANRRFALSDAADGLLATPAGINLLTFLISCALPEGVTITRTVGEDVLEFFGALGLAPKWLDHPLDEKGRGWVSACLLSRVNNIAPTSFSMRGDNPELTVTATELAGYTIEEGAFFGQYFGKGKRGCSACRGSASIATLEASNRICTIPDPANPGFTKCGFKYAGLCSQACKKFVNGHWVKCTGAGKKKPVLFEEVITTFLPSRD